MPTSTRLLLVATPLYVALAAALIVSVCTTDKPAASAPVKPALTVTVTTPQPANVQMKIAPAATSPPGRKPASAPRPTACGWPTCA